MKTDYLVTFDTGHEGDKTSVLVKGVSYSDAKLNAERIARERHMTHFGVGGTQQVDADWRDL